jgi:hypothetical protein
MSKVTAVAAAIVFMLWASGSYAQAAAANGYSGTAIGQAQLGWQFFQSPSSSPPNSGLQSASRIERPPLGMMYVACWAEVPSHNAAYFTAPFLSPTVNSARTEFRQLVTTQYGAVGKLQCAGKFNETVVNEQVEKWKDSARSKSAIVDTDWQPVASLRGTTPGAQAKN